MKIKNIIILLCLLLTTPIANAEDRILNLVLIQDESGIRILDRIVSTSKIESESTNLSGYKFVVKDFDDKIIETINLGFSDKVAILSIPVSQNFLKGEIYDDKNNLMLEVDLYSHIDVGLCGDSACSGDESYESCPQDCFLERESLSLEQEIKKESKLPLIILYSAIGIVGFLIIIFGLVFLKRKIQFKERNTPTLDSKDKFRELPLEQQLQKYIQNALKHGLDKEDIKNELLQTVWPLDLIEKNLK